MKLLGLMAIANGRLIKEDMDCFKEMMMELRAVIDPSLVMTPRMAQDWFAHNKDMLTAVIEGLEYDSQFIEMFKQMRSFPFKLDVVTAMMRVGIADGDYGRIEKMFVKKTILYWNIRGGEKADMPENIYARKRQARVKS